MDFYQTAFTEPNRIANLLCKYKGQWMIAGGWAIDVYLNKITRTHQDIEIAIPRKEQFQLKNYLKDWKLRYVVSGKFYDWLDGQYLELPIHEIHGENENKDQIEILLNEIGDGIWKFRRNLKIQYPLELAKMESAINIPILSPEIVLLYKAKWGEEKDKSDFRNVLPNLEKNRKRWLKEAIYLNHGDHEWYRKI